MSNETKYWKGVEELNDSPAFQQIKNKEFSEYIPVEDFIGDENTVADSKTSRRDFLKYLGFGVTAASLAACETPVNKVIPYVVKGDKVNPGVANYFATTFSDGTDYCDIVVKTREGRPIRIDSNVNSPFSLGGINARVNSSLLSLYDGKRYKAPMVDGAESDWFTFNSGVKKAIETALANGGKVRFLTNSITSPSTLKIVSDFVAANPDADIKHVNYDPVSFSGTLEANQESFGKAVLPNYHLDKAKVIVSVGADFVGNFPSSARLSTQYAKGRNPEKSWMSKHFQFESSMSLTGSNADVRVPVKLSEQGKVLVAIYNQVASMLGGAQLAAAKTSYDQKINAAAKALVEAKGASVVIAGANDKNAQLVANGINQMLGNYGKTIDMNNAVYLRKGNDAEVASLVDEMKSGDVDVLVVSGVNPAYSLPAEMNFAGAMEKVKTSVVFALRPNATSDKANYVGAESHFLESWDDHNPMEGHYTISQPTINPLFDTMQFQDCLLKWTGEDRKYYYILRENWENMAFANQSEYLLFDDYWNTCLQKGFESMKTSNAEEAVSFGASLGASASALNAVKGADWEVEFYQKIGIGTGNQSHNPLLQELPDPISKMTWDNYLVMNPNDAKDNGFATEYGEQKNADTVNLTINGQEFKNVPVIAQPGQARGTLGVALGYGQTIGKENEVVGINFYPAYNGMKNYSTSVSFEATGEDYQVATTQTHQTVMGRTSVVRETNLNTFKNADKDAYNPAHVLQTHHGPKDVSEIDLWAKHPVKGVGHHWGMSIDLNSCMGCGACVTACNIENNVPVVGKDEVRRSREMHWIRIDRYFSSNPEDVAEKNYTAMETPEDNPMVVHQPMMCQHCNHAPCETVCPVAATTHSNEGLNQMTYNRCIGTRYCANNCPYKVRRFNWFSYQNYSKFSALNPAQDDLGRMVLNPDVTVRARGVMEKCSMCVQMIQETKLTAKKEGRAVRDEESKTACSSACPTNAIQFGDLNDSSSVVAERSKSNRAYRVIEEVGTQANVYYQMKVRNTENKA